MEFFEKLISPLFRTLSNFLVEAILLLRFRKTGNGGKLEFFEKIQPYLVIWSIFLCDHIFC
jgi:hypothetical protein